MYNVLRCSEWIIGDIILTEETSIGKDETAGELWDRLSKMGAKLLVETLSNIEKGKIIRTKQPSEFTIAPKLEKEISRINWNEKTAKQIKDLVRGLTPGMGAFSLLNNKKVKFWKVEVISENDYKFSKIANNIENGMVIYSSDKDGLFIKAKEGIISVIEIQGENSKKMNVKEFLRGNRIDKGWKFE